MDLQTTFLLQNIIVLLFAATIMLLIMRHYTKKLETRIEEFLVVEEKRETSLRNRERLVVAAALEGELKANQTKIEAFLLIYQEMLRGLKEPSKAPKYKQGGEIIHQRPALSRTIFDAYADRLDLLGSTIAADLSELYGAVETDPVYKTLSPDLDPNKAIRVVEKIVDDAKAMLIPIERTMGGLSVIVRNQKINSANATPL